MVGPGLGLTPVSDDKLLFVGYVPGATFTQNDAAHWQVNNGGTAHEVITFLNGTSIDASDVFFI